MIAQNPLAIYTLCYSHRLNLVVAKSIYITLVRNMMGEVKEISYFFNFSEVRNVVLQHTVKELCSDSHRTKLVDVCRTRWIERIDGLHIFQDLFPALSTPFKIDLCE